MAGDTLNPKQQRFVEEYLIDLNATQAAIRAGYSKKTAKSQGQRLLTHVDIKTAIDEAKRQRSKRTDINADWVLQRLAQIAEANLNDFMSLTNDGEPFIDLSEATPEQMYALSEVLVTEYKEGRGKNARDIINTKIKMSDRLKALELIGRHVDVQAFKDKLELSGQLDLAKKIMKRRGKKDG